ncbi:hypothetical protein Vretimale_9965 [Volvox reticuliferus]|uniref:Uncharacterized protein n=1 Tax=Volvox reticuliferus TaxID=1737510 RepID=A0A8J4FPQ7_9CHLO|nr:hypothetical protein Vretifemale_13750 [Volvox reticuliferus]GIM05493.1 hypothetical protein Vretimale_9965 [Volvox reticuliferus]
MPLQHHVHRPWNTTAGIWTTSYRTCTHVPLRSAQIPWVLTLSPYPGVSTSGLPSAHAQSATTRLDALAPDNVERDVPPVDWADGDVLRLHLDDGEHVYAEALAGAPSRTKAARQLSRSIGTPGAAPSGSQILCGGVRYIVRTGATKTTQAGAAAAPLESAGDVGPVMVLEAAGGALAASEPLRDLLAVPPKKHAPALRSWAPLTARLVKPTAPRQQHQHQQLQATYSGSLHGVHVVRADRVMTLGELRRRAATEPGAWCDGSAVHPPDDSSPPLRPGHYVGGCRSLRRPFVG